MHIGQFSDSYPPIINGVSAFVAEHHSQLRAQRHDAHVFTFGHTRAHTRDTQPNIWRTAGLPILASGFRLNFWMNERANRAADVLDVYHAHEPFMAGLQALRIAKKYKRPFIFTNHTRHDLYIKNYPRLMQPPFQRGISSFIAAAVNNSDISTAPSEETAQLLRQIAPDAAHKVRVVRNGIRLDQFDNTSDCEARDELGIGCDSTVFMYVGRLTPEKSLPVFADALTNAVQQGVDAHWVVVGDGPCREQLSEQLAPISDRAHFLGAIPRERVAKLLAMADVFATPSLSEVNPVSVIEALASGKPYLGMKAAWWDEFGVVSHNGTAPPGWLAGDEGELAQAIIALCNNGSRRREMAVEAKKLSHRFDIRDITSQWIEIYEEAIMSKNSNV